MNKVKVGFFSFTEITRPDEHRAYNEWHQLDHMPEQLPLEGVAHGQRWVCTPACRTARARSEPELDPAHYVTLYLMTEPIDRTLTDFRDLGAQLSAMGRFHRYRRSHLGGPFLFVKAYAAPRVLVSPEAVPYRPHRGIHVSVSEPGERRGLDDWLTWLDQVRVPALLSLAGVVGVWTFTGYEAANAFQSAPITKQITVAWLDEDPVTVAGAIAGLAPYTGSASITRILESPFETIEPHHWDWFD